MKSWAVFTLLLAAACTQPANNYNQFLQSCNRVDILVYNGGDTLFFDTQDSTGISILSSQVSGSLKNVQDTCPAQGLLRFRKDSTLLLEAPFAAAGRCSHISYTYDDASHVHPLSSRAQKLLGTVLQQAGKQ